MRRTLNSVVRWLRSGIWTAGRASRNAPHYGEGPKRDGTLMDLRLLTRIHIPATESLDFGGKNLEVGLQAQEQSNWCWAACYSMVFAYYGHPKEQCRIVNMWHRLDYCCESGACSACNQPIAAGKVTYGWRAYGYDLTFYASQVTWQALGDSINADKPVEVSLEWTGGKGHLVIVDGWARDLPNERYEFVHVLDPEDDGIASWLRYDELQSAFGLGQWEWTWSEISYG